MDPISTEIFALAQQIASQTPGFQDRLGPGKNAMGSDKNAMGSDRFIMHFAALPPLLLHRLA